MAVLRTGFALAGLLVGLGAAGCSAGDDGIDEATSAREDGLKSQVFRRVVIARAYQDGNWTLPDTDVVRDAKYVCEVLASFEPTLVSGLIRLQGKHKNDKGQVEPRDDVTPEQVAFFDTVRSCMRNDHGLTDVRFDVVLNATHYETPLEIENHLDHIQGKLHPDQWYFDYYQRGYDEHPAAIAAAIDWIKGHKGQLVGGTIWGHEVPPHSDYVALDDFDDNNPAGGTHDGWTRMTKEAALLSDEHPALPLLFHIENNPTGKPTNHGEQWIAWVSEQRNSLLDKHASHQKEVGYRYMYPVFFPLSRKRVGALAQFAGIIGSDRVLAYDVNLDPPVYAETKQLMGKYNIVDGDKTGDGKGGGGKGGGGKGGGGKKKN